MKKLGEGGMGAVLLAEEPSLSRKVALKVMRPELAANPSARERFFREAKSAAAIEHDHIIPIFAVSEANGVPFLAMPFLKGQPLDQRLHAAQGPLPLAEIAHIGREIASGLAAAHEQGLIHRDIKPGNIWLEDRGPDSPARVKILDFGLARSQAEDAHLTQSGAILGTPAYMAPEQALGHKVDERADLFSLGCVLYQMATGRRPFTGETTMAVLMSLGIDAPTAPQVLNPRIPQTLSQLIMGLLVKDPTKRLASAAEVARTLRAIEMDLTPLVVPMAESVPAPAASDPWSGIDDGGTPSTAPTIAPLRSERESFRGAKGDTPKSPFAPRKVVFAIIGLLALVAGGFIIIKITNKDGTVIEVKVPDTSKIEVDGKTIVALNPDAKNNEPLPPTFKNSIGMEFVKIPKGTSWLGGGGGKPGTAKFEVENDFYLGKYEVTQEEWEAVTGEKPSHFSRTGTGKDALADIPDIDLKRFPVEQVSWDNVRSFLEQLNKREKETGWTYRLPKSAEWEYACRGGPLSDELDSAFHFYLVKKTNELTVDLANFTLEGGKGLKRPRPVGSCKPNALGLFDMHGNVWEWCDDTEKGADGASVCVNRGGGWSNEAVPCRAAFRITSPPSHKTTFLGLRIARVSVARKDATPTDLANLPPLKPINFKPIPIGESPFDKLDPKEIPKEERFEWQPKELVGLIGSHARRHWYDVRAIAFSPDGKLAATGSAGLDYIIIWDLATQTAKHRLQWTGSWLSHVDSLQFSEDGKKLFAGMSGNGSGLRIVDLSGPEPKWAPITVDEKETTEWFHQGGSRTTVFENGNTLAVFGHAVSLFDWNNGSPKRVTDKFPVTGFPVFVPKTNQMIFASPEGKLKRATIKNAKFVDDAEIPIPLEPKEYPRAVREDGKALALWVKDRVELWDVSGDKPAKKGEWKQSDTILAGSRFRISPDGRWFTGSYNETKLWRVDGNEPKLVASLDQTGTDSSQVGFSSDGHRAIVGNIQGFVRFWDLSGAEPKELAPFDPVTAFLTNWGGIPLDSARGFLMLPRYDSQPGKGHRNQLWDLTGKRPEPAPKASSFLDAEGYGPIHFAGANRWLQITPHHQQRPRLYTLADGRWQPIGPEFGEPNCLGNVSRDGKLLIVYAGAIEAPDRLVGWDLSANPPAKKWSQSLKDHPAFETWGSRQVCFSADGRWFATTAKANKADGPWKLVVWRNTGAKPEVYAVLPCTWQPHLYVAAFSPDGRYLAHTPEVNHTVSIMDLSGPMPREARRIEGNLSVIGQVQALAFHPDGKHLAYGSHFSAGVLDVTTGKPVWEWKAPGPVDRLDWAADGRHLVTHNGNKTVYVLRLNQLAPTALGPQTDRQVAEWVLGVGGKVQVKGNDELISDVKKLPAGEVTITYVNLNDCPISDHDLARLSTLKSIEHLTLSHCPITDNGLRFVAALTTLRGLALRACRKLSGKGFVHLAKLTNLRSLNLTIYANVTDTDIEPLLGLKEIEDIALSTSVISAAGLAKIRTAYAKISHLEIGDVPLNDAAVAELARMTNLRSLSLNNNGLVDRHLVELAKLANLRFFQCSSDKIGELGLKAIGQMTKLTMLNLNSIPLAPALLAHLESLPLESLNLENCMSVDDSFVAALSRFKSLKEFNLFGTKFTEAGAKKLFAALPECTITYPGGVIGPKK